MILIYHKPTIYDGKIVARDKKILSKRLTQNTFSNVTYTS